MPKYFNDFYAKNSILVGFVALVIAFSLNMYSCNVLIPLIAPARPVLIDSTFTLLPYWKEAYVVNDYIQISMIIFFLWVGYKYKFKNLDKYLLALSLIYTLRAIAVIMNPAGYPWSHYDLRHINLKLSMLFDQNGLFFSGHTSLAFMLSLFTLRWNRKFGLVMSAVAVVSVVLIMVGRSHYIMDVYGGLVTSALVAYIFGLLPLKRFSKD